MLKQWGDFTSGSSINFDPVNDQFKIEDAALSAADFTISSPTANTTKFAIPGKSITLKTPIEKLTSTNVIFADHSLLRIGGETTDTGDDPLANTLTGMGKDDQLIGLAGNDKLDGKGGADKMVGGAGNDTYTVDSDGDVVKESGGEGTDLVKASINYVLDNNVEKLTLLGDGPLSGGGNELDNVIKGNAGQNLLQGEEGNDVLKGGGAGDSLLGGKGSDVLDGGAGDDVMVGGTGNDRYTVNNDLDTVSEALDAGTDQVISKLAMYELDDNVENLKLSTGAVAGYGNNLGNTIDGNNAANHLYGLGQKDVLNGGGGNDILDGGAGADTMDGGAGDDLMYVDNAHDITTEAADEGSDTVVAFASHTIGDNIEWLNLANDLAIDGTGNAIDNVLNGSNGANHLFGMGGNDQIYGNGAGAGFDVMYGGDGNDVIQYLDGDHAHGDAGEDQLIAQVSGLDLFGLAGDEITGFEEIFLNQSDETISLSAEDVILVSDAGTLRLRGEGTVMASGTWLQGEDVVYFNGEADETLSQYTRDGATLLVGQGIDTSNIELFASSFALSSLDGDNGFRLDGIYSGDRSGWSVGGAGDIDGDGYDDVLVGAPYADPGGVTSAGQGYLVFGDASHSPAVDLFVSAPDGFRLDGFHSPDRAAMAVSGAGDVNGDGFADFIIGARYASPGGSNQAGQSYIVFGASSFGDALALNEVGAEAAGFRLDGGNASDRTGYSVAGAGDVNGDGYDDVLVTSTAISSYAGATYLVFGKASAFPEFLSLSSLGADGVTFTGAAAGERSGRTVASAGDFNADGYQDIIIGAHSADTGFANSGSAYVVFGGADLSGMSLSSLDGSNGFVFTGNQASNQVGLSVNGAGDVNGDGYDDVIIGSGIGTYVVFGNASGFDSLTSADLDGSNGFKFNIGGFSVSGVGDVNGDGYDDLAVGEGFDSVRVIFGSSHFASTLSSSELDGSNGFVITPDADGAYAGRAVSAAGDVNGDGFADILIGVRDGDPDGHLGGGAADAGESYVVYGRDFSDVVDFVGDDQADTFNGTSADEAFVGGDGNDTLTGGGGADAFHGGRGDDRIVLGSGGALRVDGGGGTDTVNIDALGSFQLDAMQANRWSGIEKIDLGGSGQTTLGIAAAGVPGLGNQFLIKGDAGDMVTLGAGWVNDGAADTPMGEGGAYTAWVNGGTTLFIEDELTTFSGELALSVVGAGPNDTGFELNGVFLHETSGYSVSSAGDVNGDGFDDFLIGAPNDAGLLADNNGGSAWLVFGKSGAFTFDGTLGSINGTNGTAFGTSYNSYDAVGWSVSAAGDVNGDGLADVLIGAPGVSGGNGAAYVVFGKASFSSFTNATTLNGTTGFKVTGFDTAAAGGTSVSAGDVNGDGYSDIIVGAPGAVDGYGATYVIYGRASGFTATIDVSGSGLDGTNGFSITGSSAYSVASGSSVALAGDLNGDGFDDIVIGAPASNEEGGSAFVIYGSDAGFDASFQITEENVAFGVFAEAGGDHLGRSISTAGDINGDGNADLVVGAPFLGENDDGAAYVLFGGGTSVDLADLSPENGFRIDGRTTFANAGWSVDSAGDINGDGYDDLLIGAPSGPGDDPTAGEAYVVFGRASGFGTNLNLSSLDGMNGFRLDGDDDGTYAGSSVAAIGDINGDGYDDLIVGAPYASPVDTYEGRSYVVYGRAFDGAVDYQGGTGDDSLHGTSAAEAYVGGRGNDTMDGHGGMDAFRGGAGNDVMVIGDEDFLRVDGGTGIDTLMLDEGVSLFFDNLGSEAIRGIERIDLSAEGANTIQIDSVGDVTQLSDSSNELRVTGTSDDVVQLVGDWTLDHTSAGFEFYTWEGATVKVALAVDVEFPT